jgi:hypothetical protein
LAQNWKKHLVQHPKKRQALGLALVPAEGAALGLALVPAAEGARQGLNRRKLISRQEFIGSKWLPTAEIINDRACFHSSLCAFTYCILTLMGTRIDVCIKIEWHTGVMLACAIP